MNITQVQIHLNEKASPPKVKAWADIVIDKEFIIRGLAIRENTEKDYCFVTMPYKVRNTNHDEVREDVAHPITEDCRRYIENTVLDKGSKCFPTDEVYSDYDEALKSFINYVEKDITK